jgi:glutamate decarboxylase
MSSFLGPSPSLGSLEKKPGYVTSPNRKDHELFLRQIFEMILKQNIFEGIQRDEKVCRFKLPDDLKKIINLEVGREPVTTQQELIEFARQVSSLSVKTGHPYFINQLFSGLDPYGLAGELVASSLNSSVYTYEVSPVFTMMELEVFQKMREIVGFPQGKGDGIMSPGGSISNGYGISVARFHKRPDTKEKGLSGGKPMVLFISEDAHYSCKKLASFEGIGADNAIGVKVDSRGKIIPEKLEEDIRKSLSENKEPFMVIATAGTTVMGAFDPLDDIAEICKKYSLWFHVDAAWGGGALMSAKHRHLLKGIEKADSVTWNPHKLLCAPQQCSVFLCKDENILTDCHAAHATYLFQKDKFYDSQHYDTGDKYIQCGRRADILKFWLMWKAKGTQGFEQHIDHIFNLKELLVEEIKKRGDRFKLLIPEYECTNVCFWYVPISLRDLETDSTEFRKRINTVAPKIKEKMMKNGSMMVSYQPLREYPNFFRTIFESSGVTPEDITYFLDQFEKLGEGVNP